MAVEKGRRVVELQGAYLAGVVGPVRGEVQGGVRAEAGRAVHVHARHVVGAAPAPAPAPSAPHRPYQHVGGRHLADQDTYTMDTGYYNFLNCCSYRIMVRSGKTMKC